MADTRPSAIHDAPSTNTPAVGAIPWDRPLRGGPASVPDHGPPSTNTAAVGAIPCDRPPRTTLASGPPRGRPQEAPLQPPPFLGHQRDLAAARRVDRVEQSLAVRGQPAAERQVVARVVAAEDRARRSGLLHDH